MTKTSMTLLAVACALALSACGGSEKAAEGEHAATETAHASSSAGLPNGHIEAGKALAAER